MMFLVLGVKTARGEARSPAAAPRGAFCISRCSAYTHGHSACKSDSWSVTDVCVSPPRARPQSPRGPCALQGSRPQLLGAGTWHRRASAA